MRERIYPLASIMVALTLAGCSGIEPGKSPTTQFTVPLTLQETYNRAMAQTEYCLVTKDNLPISGSVAASGQSAQIQVMLQFVRTVVARVDMKSLSAQSTQVDVLMWGVDVWDQTAADAMRAAIEFGVPSCTNYFPTTKSERKKR